MRSASGLLVIATLLLTSGCFSFQRRVSFSDTLRLEVTFENAAAAKAFFAAFDAPAARFSDWEFTVSPLLLMGVEFVLHEKEWHNHLVRRADINRDLVITEAEARMLSPATPSPPASPADADQ